MSAIKNPSHPVKVVHGFPFTDVINTDILICMRFTGTVFQNSCDLIAVYNKPIYAIDEETVKRYPVGTITESGNGS